MSTTLWMVDRSRYETGLGRCARERFLEYHFGPSGYGIRATASSMPQIRGIYIHEGIAYLMAHLQAEETLPTEVEVRAAVALATGKYNAVVDARGLRLLDAGDTVATIAKEQCALLTGVIWTFALEVLPWFHTTYKVVDVEREEIAVLGCTCGLGDMVGTGELHEARGCFGIGWMSRADCIAEHRSTGQLAYFEIKTGGYATRAEDWETKIQFAAAVLGAEARLERPIDESWVLNLLVGKREGAYNYETKKKDGPLRQQSVFCYGYRKLPPAPGMVEEWAAEYEYLDDQGRNRRLGKDWQKAPIWEMDPQLTGGVDPAEYWARWIGPALRLKQVNIVGPLNRQQVLLDGFKEEVVAEERQWQATTWALYEQYEALAERGVENPWAHQEYQSLLNQLVRRSWACNRFGARYQCQFTKLCFRREGWEDPLASGFMLRRPHHTPEITQAEARGIALPVDEGEGED